MVLFCERRKFFGRGVRIETGLTEWRLPAAQNVDHKALAILMTDRNGVGITATAAGVNETLISDPRTRRQFQRTTMLDRSLDELIVEKAAMSVRNSASHS